VVVEAGGRGDCGGDVVRATDAEALAALVGKQRGSVFGAGPVVAFVEPAGERAPQLRVDWDVADAFAFAEDPQDAFAGGARDVVDVERDISLIRAAAFMSRAVWKITQLASSVLNLMICSCSAGSLRSIASCPKRSQAEKPW
jgi:hypothetical protein